MNDMKKAWITRIAAGGFIGTVVMTFLGLLFNSFADFTLTSSELDWVSYDLIKLAGSKPSAALLQFSLYFALGAGVGIATLPFAEEGKELLIRSTLHFGYMAAVSSALIWLCGWNRGDWLAWLLELALLALLYVLIWFGRWLAWWFEVDEIREKLGLTLPPSPLKWRESLPHTGFAFLLCGVVPALLYPISLTSDLYFVSLLYTPLCAVASCPPGVSLGKRHGVCPLYPATCLLFFLVPNFGLYYRSSIAPGYDPLLWYLLYTAMVFAAALAGNLSGAARHKHKQRKGNPAYE